MYCTHFLIRLMRFLVIINQLNKLSGDRFAQCSQRPQPAGPRSTEPGLCCLAMLGPLEFKSQPKGVCCSLPLFLFCKALSRSSCAFVGFILDGFFFSVKGIFLQHSRLAVIFARQWNQCGVPARSPGHLVPPAAPNTPQRLWVDIGCDSGCAVANSDHAVG